MTLSGHSLCGLLFDGLGRRETGLSLRWSTPSSAPKPYYRNQRQHDHADQSDGLEYFGKVHGIFVRRTDAPAFQRLLMRSRWQAACSNPLATELASIFYRAAMYSSTGRSGGLHELRVRHTTQMSAFGTKRTSRHAQSMSAFGGKADITSNMDCLSEGIPGGIVGELEPAEIGSKSQTDP